MNGFLDWREIELHNDWGVREKSDAMAERWNDGAKMMDELSREDGFAAIMTTHNPDHPVLLNSSVCLFGRDGRLLKGSVEDIMQEDVLEEVYQARLIIRDVADAGRRVCMTPVFGGR